MLYFHSKKTEQLVIEDSPHVSSVVDDPTLLMVTKTATVKRLPTFSHSGEGVNWPHTTIFTVKMPYQGKINGGYQIRYYK